MKNVQLSVIFLFSESDGKQLKMDGLATLRDAACLPEAPIPPMDQPHFISMWKSFYDIFIQQKNEQQAYHSIVSVGTLLIKLGDVSNRSNSRKKSVALSPPALEKSSGSPKKVSPGDKTSALPVRHNKEEERSIVDITAISIKPNQEQTDSVTSPDKSLLRVSDGILISN